MDKKEKDIIDFELGEKILSYVNSENYSGKEELDVKSIPMPDNRDIFKLDRSVRFQIDKKKAEKNLIKTGLPPEILKEIPSRGDMLDIDFDSLYRTGLRLIPFLSYGILNGGSATSYGDIKHNISFNPQLFEEAEKEFIEISKQTRGTPKGITSAFINPDGTPGADFIELKMRSVLINILRSSLLTGKPFSEYRYPIFQMTSFKTVDKLAAKYKLYKNSPLLKELIDETGIDITEPESRTQYLIPAFTHTSQGFPLRYFKTKNGDLLPLPGGHGQNFFILRSVYEKLLEKGKKFVYLGNVDNIGFTIFPAALAILAISGKQAGFDFSFKTPVDVKGGILIRGKCGKLNCGEINRSISEDFVRQEEEAGVHPLFNCATGLFNLEYLVKNIDRIIKYLPVRLSDHNKDIGLYSHAEQNTWEIIGLLDDFMIFAVNKAERFISSKLLLENMITSDLPCCRAYLKKHQETEFAKAAASLHKGLNRNLAEEYGMELKDNRWIPSSVEELSNSFHC